MRPPYPPNPVTKVPSKAANHFSLEVTEHDFGSLYMSAVASIENPQCTAVKLSNAIAIHFKRGTAKVINESQVHAAAIAVG